MSLTVEQYIGLSALAYDDLKVSTDNPEANKLSNIIDFDSKPEFKSLSGIANWTLIAQSNTSSGFSAAAFKSPSGEIVFSFQGTDLSKDWGVDGAADFGIFMRESYSTISKHLDDAKSFVYSVLNNPDNKGANYSFTGHSLGGAIAQYMTYVTNTDNIAGVGKAITFNAPGIGEVIKDKHNTNINPRDYDHLITDYVNESDVIGDWRTEHQLGRTVYVRSKLNTASGQDVKNVTGMVFAQSDLGKQILGPLESLRAIIKGSESMVRLTKNIVPFANHSMSDMEFRNGNPVEVSGNRPAMDSSFIGYLAEGTSIAIAGGKFAIVTTGEIIGGRGCGACDSWTEVC